MINLLPAKTKLDYRYARRNKHLFKWVLVLLFGILGAVLITGAGFFYLHQLTTSYQQQLETSRRQLKEQNLDGVNAQIKDMSNNLKLADEVLSKQILFSKLLSQLGSRLPNNTVLSGLTVSQTQGAIDITALTKDYASATQVQINLSAEDNGLFSKVDTINLACADTATSQYPCTATFRALFSPNSQIALTAKSAAGKAKP